jgi:hypothetical protein
MHKFFTSSFDASIYLQQPEQNAGRDEILEVGKLYYGSSKDIARTLIKFDTGSIKSEIQSIGTGSWQTYLVLRSANSQEIPLEYSIYANAVSQSWTMGTGTKFDNITSDGISWKYRDGINTWQDNVTAGTAVFITGSWMNTTGSANAEGGTWYITGSATQSFSNEPDDVRMNVTNIVKQWCIAPLDNGGLPNNGFIVRHSIDVENNDLDYGLLKFFSKETNTIYEPKLELVWDDSTFITGSLTPVTGSAEDGYKVVVTNLKREYPANSKVKIRVKGRDMYPLKSFGTTFQYDQSKYLPSGSSYYQIEDYITNEIIVPFGDYSKLSCDSTSNYFNLDTSAYPYNRTYKLKLKIVESGISTIIDDKMVFEIIE